MFLSADGEKKTFIISLTKQSMMMLVQLIFIYGSLGFQ